MYLKAKAQPKNQKGSYATTISEEVSWGLTVEQALHRTRRHYKFFLIFVTEKKYCYFSSRHA